MSHGPLEAWRRTLETDSRTVPSFDPADGGAAARLLLLLETPGPGASPLAMVSRDHPTGTARNLARFLSEASIARADTIIWNAVPWLLHAPGARNRAPRAPEVAAGLATLPGLLDHLPRLTVVVLAGRIAGRAAPVIATRRPDLRLIAMPHPSPTYVCTSPDVGNRIRAALAQAATFLAARPFSSG